MKAIFYAAGPDIRAGVTVAPFENVNVYPFIAKILGLTIGPIDGKLKVLQNMPGLDGFGLLARLRDAGEMPPAIVLTAYGNIETAVKTVHELGAYWFLEK